MEKHYIEAPGDSYGNTAFGFRVVKGVIVEEDSLFSKRKLQVLYVSDPPHFKERWPGGVCATMFIECDGPARELTPAQHRRLTNGHGCKPRTDYGFKNNNRREQ